MYLLRLYKFATVVLAAFPECDEECMENLELSQAFKELGKVVNDADVDKNDRAEYEQLVAKLKPNIVYDEVCGECDNILMPNNNSQMYQQLKDDNKTPSHSMLCNEQNINLAFNDYSPSVNNQNSKSCPTTFSKSSCLQNKAPVVITSIIPAKTFFITSTLIDTQYTTTKQFQKQTAICNLKSTQQSNLNSRPPTALNSSCKIQASSYISTIYVTSTITPSKPEIVETKISRSKIQSCLNTQKIKSNVKTTTCSDINSRLNVPTQQKQQTNNIKPVKKPKNNRPIIRVPIITPIITYTQQIVSTITSHISTTVIHTSYMQQPIYYPPQIITQTITLPNPTSPILCDIKKMISAAILQKKSNTVYVTQPQNKNIENLYYQQQGELMRLNGELSRISEMFRQKTCNKHKNNKVCWLDGGKLKRPKITCDNKKKENCTKEINKKPICEDDKKPKICKRINKNVTINKGIVSPKERCELEEQAKCNNKNKSCKEICSETSDPKKAVIKKKDCEINKEKKFCVNDNRLTFKDCIANCLNDQECKETENNNENSLKKIIEVCKSICMNENNTKEISSKIVSVTNDEEKTLSNACNDFNTNNDTSHNQPKIKLNENPQNKQKNKVFDENKNINDTFKDHNTQEDSNSDINMSNDEKLENVKSFISDSQVSLEKAKKNNLSEMSISGDITKVKKTDDPINLAKNTVDMIFTNDKNATRIDDSGGINDILSKNLSDSSFTSYTKTIFITDNFDNPEISTIKINSSELDQILRTASNYTKSIGNLTQSSNNNIKQNNHQLKIHELCNNIKKTNFNKESNDNDNAQKISKKMLNDAQVEIGDTVMLQNEDEGIENEQSDAEDESADIEYYYLSDLFDGDSDFN